MNTTQQKRLRKLIAFLRTLDSDHFDFEILRHESNQCGTIACAIGWTPTVFPSLIKVVMCGDTGDGLKEYDVAIRGENIKCASEVPQFLFGLDWGAFIPGGGVAEIGDDDDDAAMFGVKIKTIEAPGKAASPCEVADYLERIANHFQLKSA